MTAEDRFFEELRDAHFITRALISAFTRDAWPGDGVARAFGLDTVEHYEALRGPFRAREISPGKLDAAMGDGGRLTALAREAPSNPRKDLTFSTFQDIAEGHAPGVEAPDAAWPDIAGLGFDGPEF